MEINRLKSKLYMEDVADAAARPLPWDDLKDQRILISGASGLIGTFLIDVLMYRNQHTGMNTKIYACLRNQKKAEERFSSYLDAADLFEIIAADVNQPLKMNIESAGYVIHLASNTHPVQYATDPIRTIMNSITGTQHMLEFALGQGSKRVLFASSNEVYGENRGDTELFSEDYCGYIDCNTLRAGYPEGKRCGEALCQAYRKEKGLNIVIARLTRTFGPTIREDDTKASSQFLNKGIRGENIVLKSAGNQYYSYTYVSDAVTGLLTVLLLGEDGEAYNIADESCDITLKDFAGAVAEKAGTQVVFELPDQVEAQGYSKATKARLDGSKIRALGWTPRYDIRQGLGRTMDILTSKDR